MFPSESTNSQRIVYSGEESMSSKSAMYVSGQISSSAGDESSHNQDNGGRGTTPSQAAQNRSNEKHPFKSVNFAEAYAEARARAMFQVNRPIKPMKPVIMQADTTENFPGGKFSFNDPTAETEIMSVTPNCFNASIFALKFIFDGEIK